MTPYEMTKIVHAEQLTVENAKGLAELVKGRWNETIEISRPGSTYWSSHLWWAPDEIAHPGDYVVQEPDGSYHAWDKNIFEAIFRERRAAIEDESPTTGLLRGYHQ